MSLPSGQPHSGDSDSRITAGKQIPPHGYPIAERPVGYPQQTHELLHSQASQYHGHPLPNQPESPHPTTSRRTTTAYLNVVGFDGYPQISQRSEERSRFTREDDEKLKFLKEQKTLSWRQIEDFFPGRKSGTLQVRYCTKLKDKRAIEWNSELDRKLRKVMRDDDSNKWARVAQKLGNNVTPQACQERWSDIESIAEEVDPEAYE